MRELLHNLARLPAPTVHGKDYRRLPGVVLPPFPPGAVKKISNPLLVLSLALAILAWTTPSGLVAQPAQEPTDTLTTYQLGHGWFTRDKSYHLTVSAVGAAVIYGAGREIGLGRWPSAIGSSLVMTTLGILREVYADDEPNRLSRKAFSRKDMAWNGAGIVLGISLTDLLGRRRWSQPRHHTNAPVDPPPIGQR